MKLAAIYPIFPILVLFTASSQASKYVKWAQSIEGLQYLAENELELYELVKHLETGLETKSEQVSSWLDDFEQSSLKGTRHLTDRAEIVEEIVSHPLLALRMIRRFVNVKQMLEDLPDNAALQHLNSMRKMYDLPSSADLENAMENIIHLRYVYELNVNDIINGKISSIQTNVGLTALQAYEIAHFAETRKSYTEALLWLQPLFEVEVEDSAIDSDQLQMDVERISSLHDELLDTITGANFWDYPHRFTTKISGHGKDELVTLTEDIASEFPAKESPHNQIKFYKLCAGHVFMTESEQLQLTCFYESKLHPSWTIAPLKIEVQSWHPYLIRIYDVLTQPEIDYLQKASRPTLKAAAVLYSSSSNSSENSERIESSRVASHTFLQETTTILQTIKSRIGRMTGLQLVNQLSNGAVLVSSEQIQIAAYAHGGHYNFHFDNLPESARPPLVGDRIATFMIYLNDVRLGGHTAFPAIGISVQPIKKSAVFWYNLKRNGSVEPRSLHGGCPVIFGTKWISNTWIRSFASFQKRKCSLNRDE